MQFEPIEILDPGRALDTQIADFVNSDLLGALLEEFGIGMPTGSLHERLLELEARSEVWNYRQGKERNFIEVTEWHTRRRDLVRAAAGALGLVVGSGPPNCHYDEVLILGGLVRACFSRPAEAARLVRKGLIEATRITALCGFRALAGNEFDLAQELGFSDLDDEFDAMEAGVRRAFSIVGDPTVDEGASSDLVGGSWRVRQLRDQPSPAVRVVAAPSSEPERRRATTADTYKWFGEDLADLDSESRLLLVTSAIYVPYQHADAIRMLTIPYGVKLDTVGVPTERIESPLRQTFEPQHYLQEVRSMIRSYRMLLEALS